MSTNNGTVREVNTLITIRNQIERVRIVGVVGSGFHGVGGITPLMYFFVENHSFQTLALGLPSRQKSVSEPRADTNWGVFRTRSRFGRLVPQAPTDANVLVVDAMRRVRLGLCLCVLWKAFPAARPTLSSARALIFSGSGAKSHLSWCLACQGCAAVQMVSVEDATAAIAELSGATLDGRTIRVNTGTDWVQSGT